MALDLGELSAPSRQMVQHHFHTLCGAHVGCNPPLKRIQRAEAYLARELAREKELKDQMLTSPTCLEAWARQCGAEQAASCRSASSGRLADAAVAARTSLEPGERRILDWRWACRRRLAAARERVFSARERWAEAVRRKLARVPQLKVTKWNVARALYSANKYAKVSNPTVRAALYRLKDDVLVRLLDRGWAQPVAVHTIDRVVWEDSETREAYQVTEEYYLIRFSKFTFHTPAVSVVAAWVRGRGAVPAERTASGTGRRPRRWTSGGASMRGARRDCSADSSSMSPVMVSDVKPRLRSDNPVRAAGTLVRH